MKGFCPLASGSKGNVIFFGTEQTRLLIDAGISAKVASERLKKIGVPLEDIEAILITHEHSDHIRGLTSLAIQHQIPVFANKDTAQAIIETLGKPLPKLKIFSTGEIFEFGDLEIHPFSVQHDTLDPVAFTIKSEGMKVGFCTDLGFVTTSVQNHLQACDYLYIEANHEPSLVHASRRPMTYKQRVLSHQGHLSNQQCVDLLTQVAHQGLRHIHLAHLSQECNNPYLALQKVRDRIAHLGYSTKVSIAYQNQVSHQIFF